ncbi:zf-DNL-domain-containing protein [Hysterangium stoloniferum]|nr:zf-DNL-domain-containing protein [Hysterangium stoloniferum]
MLPRLLTVARSASLSHRITLKSTPTLLGSYAKCPSICRFNSNLPRNMVPSTGPLEPSQPRLSLTFTCTANGCSHRSTHEFSKASYERGIVLVQCPSCKNRHLIADHLGWFKEATEDGKLRTIEDLMRAKGENIRKGRLDVGGTVEYVEN